MKKSAFFKTAKIDLQKIISDALLELAEIRASERTQSAKTQAEKRLGMKIKTAIFTDGRKKGDSKQVALTTANKYLTKVRKAIAAANFKHHGLDKKLDLIAAKLPAFAARFEAVKAMTCSDAQAELRAISKEVAQSRDAVSKKAAQSIAALEVVPETIKHLALSADEKEQLTAKKEAAIVAKQSALIKVKASDIRDLTARLLASNDAHSLALGVALATGRRQYEVLHLAKFEAAKKGRLIVSNLAKKARKTDASAVELEPLAPAAMVLDAVERLRASPECQRVAAAIAVEDGFYNEAERFNNASRDFTRAAAITLGLALGKKAGAETSAFNPTGWTFKDSRALFARMSYAHYEAATMKKGGALMDESLYFTQVLGHGDAEAQRAYRAFKIIGDVEAVSNETVAKLQEEDAAQAESAAAKRLRGIKKLAKSGEAEQVRDIFEKMIAALSADAGGIKITTQWLRANVGGKNTRLSVVMALIRDNELQTPKEQTTRRRG